MRLGNWIIGAWARWLYRRRGEWWQGIRAEAEQTMTLPELRRAKFLAIVAHVGRCYQCAGGTEWCPDAEQIGLDYDERIKAAKLRAEADRWG
jgi:hypothetical protein